MALSRVCHGASFLSHIEIKVLQCMGHRTKRILRIERKEYQTY